MSADGDDYVDSPQYTRNPSPPPELQDELIHGDSIGETAFSKHWLFTTLMKLIQEVDKENESKDAQEAEFGVDIDEELQNELCKLWDMSMNADVAVFLQEFKAVEILSGVIAKSKAPRVTEICVGILGNMACDKSICEVMSENEKLIKMVVMMVDNPDPPTLVEMTRLLYTCLSNRGCSPAWISAIRAEQNFFTNICFILHSSTNSELLKNTGECVDALLDQDEEMCASWATQELVESLLEAVKQIGYSHSETLETFMHIFQLLSTSEDGVTSLVQSADELQMPLLKYLMSVCEYEIVGFDGNEGCLASALSVLNVLFTSSHDVEDKLTSEPDLIRILLKILEPLFPLIPENDERLSSISPSDLDASMDRGQTETKEITGTCESNGKVDAHPSTSDKNLSNNASERDISVPDSSSTIESEAIPESQTSSDAKAGETEIGVETGGSEKEPSVRMSEDAVIVSESSEVNVQKYRLLYGVLQGFLTDLILSLVMEDDPSQDRDGDNFEDSGSRPLFISLLHYLDASCSRRRINYMLMAVHPEDEAQNNPIKHLEKLCRRFSVERLHRIITDFKDGNIYLRSDSANMADTNS